MFPEAGEIQNVNYSVAIAVITFPVSSQIPPAGVGFISSCCTSPRLTYSISNHASSTNGAVSFVSYRASMIGNCCRFADIWRRAIYIDTLAGRTFLSIRALVVINTGTAPGRPIGLDTNAALVRTWIADFFTG